MYIFKKTNKKTPKTKPTSIGIIPVLLAACEQTWISWCTSRTSTVRVAFGNGDILILSLGPSAAKRCGWNVEQSKPRSAQKQDDCTECVVKHAARKRCDGTVMAPSQALSTEINSCAPAHKRLALSSSFKRLIFFFFTPPPRHFSSRAPKRSGGAGWFSTTAALTTAPASISNNVLTSRNLIPPTPITNWFQK